MGYTKQDIDFHNDGGMGGPYHPAVNVKVRFRHGPDVDETCARFHCAEATAEKALEWAFDMHAQDFWERAEEHAREILGPGVKVWQAGRSGGWLTVEGLPTADTWDAIALSRWRSFENRIRAEVDYLSGKEAIFESIEANEWAIDDQSLSAAVCAALDA